MLSGETLISRVTMLCFLMYHFQQQQKYEMCKETRKFGHTQRKKQSIETVCVGAQMLGLLNKGFK